MSKKGFIYARCSTTHQCQGEDSLTVDAQVERCRSYAEFSGLEVGGVFTDLGVSGKKDRETFEECVQEVIRSKGTLMIYSLSRASRKTKSLIELSERLSKNGCEIVSISEKIDTSSAIGKYFFTTLSALAQLESDQVSERTKNSLRHKKSQGLVYSKNAPYGFRKVEGRLVEDEQEQVVIKEIKTLSGQGVRQRTIAEHLNESGFKNRSGGSFGQTQVCRILKAS